MSSFIGDIDFGGRFVRDGGRIGVLFMAAGVRVDFETGGVGGVGSSYNPSSSGFSGGDCSIGDSSISDSSSSSWRIDSTSATVGLAIDFFVVGFTGVGSSINPSFSSTGDG